MELIGEKVLLRDMIEDDIGDRIYWETVENEWQLWDGPWDYEGKSAEELKAESLNAELLWKARVEVPFEERSTPRSLEICLNTQEKIHIGWCGVYQIDESCCIVQSGTRFAIGLTIPDRAMRGKGYAADTLRTYIKWLRSLGISDVYTQTWSGNTAMLRLAERFGFREYFRKPGLRTVRGEKYDGLTFLFDKEL